MATPPVNFNSLPMLLLRLFASDLSTFVLMRYCIMVGIGSVLLVIALNLHINSIYANSPLTPSDHQPLLEIERNTMLLEHYQDDITFR